MFKKSIEAIIEAGLKEMEDKKQGIEGYARSAGEIIVRCESELRTLVQLAKDVPEKIFDRYSSVMVSSVEVHSNDSCSPRIQFGYARGPFELRGLMGEEQIKPGKYRVVVLLEKLE